MIWQSLQSYLFIQSVLYQYKYKNITVPMGRGLVGTSLFSLLEGDPCCEETGEIAELLPGNNEGKTVIKYINIVHKEDVERINELEA